MVEESLGGIKSKAYLIIFAAFFIGVVTGTLLMNLVAAKTGPTPKPTLVDELALDLKLLPEQKSKIEEIYQESKQRGKEISKIIQPKMDELKVHTKAKVKNVLNESQQLQYDSWCAKRETERKSKDTKR